MTLPAISNGCREAAAQGIVCDTCGGAGTFSADRGGRMSRRFAPRRLLPYRRSGLTLLEVLVSVAIFLGSMTAIMQILSLGRRAEMLTRLQTEAVMRCESQMAEVVAGVQELKTVTAKPFDDSDRSGTWQWSLDVAESGTTGLLQLTLKTQYVAANDDVVTEFSLVRYLRDPQALLEAAAPEDSE